MYNFIKKIALIFIFTIFCFNLYALGMPNAAIINPNGSTGIFLPVNSHLSYWSYNVPEEYIYDFSSMKLKFLSSEFEDAGIIFKIATNRLTANNVSSQDIENAYLILVSQSDFNANFNSGYYLDLINSKWDYISFQQRCFYQTNEPRIPCYANPQELEFSRIENLNEFVGTDRDRAAGKAVIMLNVTDTVKNWLDDYDNNSALPLSFKLEGKTTNFYGIDAPFPSLKPGIMVYVKGDKISHNCGDNLCDNLEDCPADCSINSELNPPNVSLTVNPDSDRINADAEVEIVANATDDSGIGKIEIFVEQRKVCETENENTCRYSAVASDIGFGEHRVWAKAADIHGNSSDTEGKIIWVGSKTKPNVRILEFPEKIYPGQTHYKLDMNLSDDEGLRKIQVKIGTNLNEELFYSREFNLNGEKNYRKTVDFNVCEPWYYDNGNTRLVAKILVYDNEDMSRQTVLTRELHFPIESIAGFRFSNRGKILSYPEYAKTFGNDEVYTTFSVFWPALAVLPDVCENITFLSIPIMTCYTGDPESVASVSDTARWILDCIFDFFGGDSGNFYSHFGVENSEHLGFPSLTALLYYEIYRISGESGTCTGFTANALKIFKGGDAAAREVCNGSCSSVKDATWEDASFNIGAKQGAVISAEYLSALLNRYNRNTRQVVNEIISYLNEGKHPGISIIGFPDASDCGYATGHTLLVDFVLDMGNGIYRVYVYDSNKPEASSLYDYNIYNSLKDDINFCSYDHLPYVEMNTNTNNFLYHFSSDSDWTRGCVNVPLYFQGLTGETEHIYGAVVMALPENLLLKEDYTLPLSPEGIFMIFAGNADVSVEDENGHQTSVNSGTDNMIPNSVIIPLPGSNQNNNVIILPSSGKYTINANSLNDDFAISFFSDKKAHFNFKAGSGFKGRVNIKSLKDGIEIKTKSDLKTEIELITLQKEKKTLKSYIESSLLDNLSEDVKNRILNIKFDKILFHDIKTEADGSTLSFWLKKQGLFMASENDKAIDIKGVNLIPSKNVKEISYSGKINLGGNKIKQIINNKNDTLLHNIEVNELPEYKIPIPDSVEVITYSPVENPVTFGNQYEIKPFATGQLNKGTLSLRIALPEFDGPVNIYLGLYAPAYFPNEVFLINSDNELVKLSDGIVAWKENASNSIDEKLFGNIDTNLLKHGKYTIYTVVTPAREIQDGIPFYLWSSTFRIGE